MTTLACSYAALRFLPYRETGEFANIGVVVWAPDACAFVFKINERLQGRMRGFFPGLDVKLYREALRGVEDMLQALSHQFIVGKAATLDALTNRFHELVRTREGLMTFGPAGAMLAQSPDAALDELYQRLVHRKFTETAENHEESMRKRLKACLRTWNLSTLYLRDVRIGDERFYLNVPFAHVVDDRPQRILRPLDLDKKDCTQIYQHGDQVTAAFKRLEEFGHLPKHIIIPVRLPNSGARKDAALESLNELKRLGAQTMSMDDQDALQRAARVA